jgi:hypothetical protein
MRVLSPSVMLPLRRTFLSVPAIVTGMLVATAAYAQPVVPCPAGVMCNGSVDVSGIILKVINFILAFLGILAVLFVVIAGVRLVVSQGDDTAKEKAKKSIIYVLIGLVIVILAGTIVNFGNVVATWVP